MGLPFLKYDALGNHFVLVDERAVGARPWSELAIALCARGTGVGSDGLLVVTEGTSPGATGRMRMFNPDGTEDMCGNGARCVVHYLTTLPGAADEALVDTPAGALAGCLLPGPAQPGMIRLALGRPRLAPSEMPALLEGDRALGVDLAVGALHLPIHLVSMGTPHCVIFDPFPDGEEFAALSTAIEHHRLFPERVSVMWATVESTRSVRVRIWERGAGETLACGTGAAATAVAGILTERLVSPVRVVLPGGELVVEWAGAEAEVIQTGAVRRVFSGEWL